MKRILLILTFLLVSLQSFAQTSFPVQLTPQVTPPYPVYISDYANTNTIQDKVRLQIILNDITVDVNQIRLKLYLQGEGIMAQSNDFVIGETAIFLQGGIPLQLGTGELAPYFQFQNLQGITPATYGNALPEGIYNICFEAYDAVTNNVLSAKTCSTIVLFQNDPPLLNLPANESVIQEQNPLNIVFQWTPRHINVSNVQYEFNLVEIWDNYIDPQAAFLSSPPIFQTTLTETTLIYGPAFPQLLTGKKYAWNVRAFALDGTEEIGVFTNQGNSEIFWFSFQTPCNAPLFPEVEELSDHHAKLIWQGDSAHIDYTIKYREKNASSDWYELTTPREYITINDLNLETTYEYKIIGNCDYGSLGETIIYEFTTLSEQASAYIGCNIEPDPTDLSNQNILPELYINDIITAGDFPVTVLILDQASTPFTGKGYAVVPWLGDTKLKVEFTGIQVNTDMQLIAGEIKTTYDANWGNVDFIDEAFEIFEGDNDVTEVEVPFDIEAEDISVNDNGEIVISDPNSNVEITYPAGDDYVITDASGDVFYVDEEGNVTEGGEIAEGGPVDTNNLPGFSNGNITQLSAEGIKVIFNNDPSYAYAFDIIPDSERTQLSDFYDTIIDTEGNSYDIAHKAVKNGGTDFIKGLIETSNDSLISRLEFKTVQGVKIPHNLAGNEVTLDLSGHYSYENEAIYASLLPEQEDGTQTIAGVFTLWHLSQKDINLTIVEVNGANAPSNIDTSLNDIFGKAGVNFNVNTTAFNVDPSLYGNDTLLVGDSGILANYTNEERAIINSFKSQQYDTNQYYLFVFGNDIQPSRSIAGFMPLKRQFGFIFSNSDATEEGKDSVVKVMAHELGHGVFGLEHPFKQFETTQGNTGWLMDYSNGSSFNHMEWAQIHNPDFQLYLFQDDEDGEYKNGYLASKILQEIRCKYKNNDYQIDAKLAEYISRVLWLPNPGVKLSPIYEVKLLTNESGQWLPRDIKVVIGEKDNASTLSTTFSRSEIKYWSDTNSNYYEYDLGDIVIHTDYDIVLNAQDDNLFEEYITDNLAIDLSIAQQDDPETPNTTTTDSNYTLQEVVIVYQGLNTYIAPLLEDDNISNREFKILKGMGSCDAIELNIENRFKIIRLISEKWAIEEKKEDLVLDLLLTMPTGIESDCDSLMSKFKSNTSVYSEIANGVNDFIDGIEDNEKRLYDELFRIFSQSSYYNAFHSTGGITYDPTVRSDEFYREFKLEFESFIYGVDITCLDNYINTPALDLCNCINNIPTYTIQSISYEDRKGLITRIIQDRYEITAVEDNDDFEISVIRLLKYLPNNFDYDTFIDYMVETSSINVALNNDYTDNVNNHTLLKVLFDDIDDYNFISQNHYRKELLETFIIYTKNSQRNINRIASLNTSIKEYDIDAIKEHLMLYNYDYRNILQRLFTQATFPYGSDFYMSLSTVLSDGNGQNIVPATITIEQQLKNAFTTYDLSEKVYHPFELILFLDISKQPLLQSFQENNEDGKNSAAIMPSIMAHYASETGNAQTQTDIIQSTIDVATLFIPGAQVGTLGKIVFYADKISSLSSLAGTYYRKENPELAQTMNNISLITAGVSLTDLATSGYKTLLKNNKSSLNSLTSTQVATNLKNSSDEFINIIDNHPDELMRVLSEPNGSNSIDELANVLEKEKEALGNNLNPTDKLVVDEAIQKLRNFENIISSGIDAALLAAMRTKFSGKTEVLTWLDEITGLTDIPKLDDLDINIILAQLDGIPDNPSVLANLEADILSLKSHFNETPNSLNSWNFLDGSLVIRRDIENLENLNQILEVKMYERANISIEDLKTGINNSNTKAKMIERLKESSEINSGSSVEDILDVFSTGGKAIDHTMDVPVNSLANTFVDVDNSLTTPDLDAKWSNRQSAVTKQQKIVASELLAEARVDQIYSSRGWQRLDVDGIPPGKQGKFDRVYAKFDADGDLIDLHVIEAKGGGSVLGSRTIGNGSVAQQGSVQYRNDILDNLLQKLPVNDPLRNALNSATQDDLIKYILIRQGVDSKSNFIVKNFPQ